MVHIPATAPNALWSSLLATAQRDARRDVVAWLLEVGAPELVMLQPPRPVPPHQALCRRCIATSRPPRRVLLRWREAPPLGILEALRRGHPSG